MEMVSLFLILEILNEISANFSNLSLRRYNNRQGRKLGKSLTTKHTLWKTSEICTQKCYNFFSSSLSSCLLNIILLLKQSDNN